MVMINSVSAYRSLAHTLTAAKAAAADSPPKPGTYKLTELISKAWIFARQTDDPAVIAPIAEGVIDKTNNTITFRTKQPLVIDAGWGIKTGLGIGEAEITFKYSASFPRRNGLNRVSLFVCDARGQVIKEVPIAAKEGSTTGEVTARITAGQLNFMFVNETNGPIEFSIIDPVVKVNRFENSGWPVLMPKEVRDIVIDDVNNDCIPEVIFGMQGDGSSYTWTNAWSANAVEIKGWPVKTTGYIFDQLLSDKTVFSSSYTTGLDTRIAKLSPEGSLLGTIQAEGRSANPFAYADIEEAKGGKELVYSDSQGNIVIDRQVSSEKVPLPAGQYSNMLVLSDLNANKGLEIVSLDRNSGNISIVNAGTLAVETTLSGNYTGMAILDLAGDKGKMIVGLSSTGEITTLNPYVPGQEWSSLTEAGFLVNPATGDVNGDGRNEIIAMNKWGNMYALDDSGAILPGWPKKVSDAGDNTKAYQHFAIADINGDGKNDIFYKKHRQVWAHSYQEEFWAIDGTGRTVPGYELISKSEEPVQPPSRFVIGDTNGDSRLDLVFYEPGKLMHSFILDESSVPPYSMPWPRTSHDNMNTYAASTPVNMFWIGCNCHCDYFDIKGIGNHPSPFSERTNITFETSQEMLGSVLKIVVNDVLGRQVRQFVFPVTSVGPQSVTWDGLDQQGRSAATGTYFMSMINNGMLTASGKMLKIK